MQLIKDRVVYSASDLTNFLECEHLISLEQDAMRGLREKPARSPEAELLSRHGTIFETEFYDDITARGDEIVHVPIGQSLEELESAARLTLEYMRAGKRRVAQATFFDGQWLGRADLLERVERPSGLGAWSYEPVDAKLARRAKPYFLLQLCFYSEQLERTQGVTPEWMHLHLGTNEREKYRYVDFAAYYRGVKERFLERVAQQANHTYPNPVEHCKICRWHDSVCKPQRERDDHLCLVAGIRRDQITRLSASGAAVSTMTTLAAAADDRRPAGIMLDTFKKLRKQASLQVRQRKTGEHHYELLAPEPKRGFALLPPPSHGDLFFDMEGDPYIGEDGREYLFGVWWQDKEGPQFKAFWAHNDSEEKKAFEQFVDFVEERRRLDPDLHVYHYAHYEPTALKKMMGAHATREDQIDDWLRSGVLVDLYQIVRQSLRLSQPNYGLKSVEAFYDLERNDRVATALGSIVAYEQWLTSHDRARLDEIQDYNEKDCRSLFGLQQWLLARREEAIEHFAEPIPFWQPPLPREPTEEAAAVLSELQALKGELAAGVPENLEEAAPAQRGRWLAAHLLEYHRREGKPLWWDFFRRCGETPAELVEDGEAIGELSLDLEAPPRAEKQSLVYTLTYSPQQHRLSEGDTVYDPSSETAAGKLVSVDDERGRLELKRSRRLADQPLPRALIPSGPVQNKDQRAALRRIGRAFVNGARGDPVRYRALWDILLRMRPRVRGRGPDLPLQSETVRLEELKAIVAALDDSYLFIQGPPGAGKTYNGARLIVSLLQAGKRVGVAANSHKAIHNLLREVEKFAHEQRFRFKGLKKSTNADLDTQFQSELRHPMIENNSDTSAFPPPADVPLVAGTAWLFAREAMDSRLDYLFIDEAGQVSLADALAMGASARNLVLLGDPLQLAQVSKTTHPNGAGASVLQHLLADDPTIPPDRGVFLEHTWRMHPDVCRFISEIVYASRLQSAPECERQAIDAPNLSGTGLRFIPVTHTGNDQSSVEEAEAIATHLEGLLRGTVTDDKGATRSTAAADILVVTPYNRQVRRIKDVLRARGLAGVRVGTVDKFQGQEAPIVFYSMATSSGEDLPRHLEFLFSRNRLNVAISRARCLAVLVASPRLLEIRCKTVDQMQMVNALCRLVELAAPPQHHSNVGAGLVPTAIIV